MKRLTDQDLRDAGVPDEVAQDFNVQFRAAQADGRRIVDEADERLRNNLELQEIRAKFNEFGITDLSSDTLQAAAVNYLAKNSGAAEWFEETFNNALGWLVGTTFLLSVTAGLAGAAAMNALIRYLETELGIAYGLSELYWTELLLADGEALMDRVNPDAGWEWKIAWYETAKESASAFAIAEAELEADSSLLRDILTLRGLLGDSSEEQARAALAGPAREMADLLKATAAATILAVSEATTMGDLLKDTHLSQGMILGPGGAIVGPPAEVAAGAGAAAMADGIQADPGWVEVPTVGEGFGDRMLFVNMLGSVFTAYGWVQASDAAGLEGDWELLGHHGTWRAFGGSGGFHAQGNDGSMDFAARIYRKDVGARHGVVWALVGQWNMQGHPPRQFAASTLYSGTPERGLPTSRAGMSGFPLMPDAFPPPGGNGDDRDEEASAIPGWLQAFGAYLIYHVMR